MASTPTSSFDDPLLVEFVKALENAAERGCLLVRYCARYPDRADELRALAEMSHLLGHAEAEHEPPMPVQLGEFRLVRLVGRGGMGEIYEAYHERLQRRVAVKIIRQGRISPEAHARFVREQQTLARLHQTHIVPIHAAGEEGPLQYFAMPYIEGAALHHAV